MGQPYELLEELLPLIESYQSEFGDEDMNISSFSVWLSKKVVIRTKNLHSSIAEPHSLDSYISSSLLRLSRYAKHYSKMALCDSKLNSIDDFVLLASLAECESKRKTALITENLLEFTTGIGVLRRLLKLGFTTEFDDAEDKRSKRVKLTPIGILELQRLFGKMRDLARIITGDLPDEEKFELLTFLEHLDRFHQKLYLGKENTNFTELLKAAT